MEYQARMMAEAAKRSKGKAGRAPAAAVATAAAAVGGAGAPADEAVDDEAAPAGEAAVEEEVPAGADVDVAVDRGKLYGDVCSRVNGWCTLLLRFVPVPITPPSSKPDLLRTPSGTKLRRGNSSDSVTSTGASAAMASPVLVPPAAGAAPSALDTVLAWQLSKHRDSALASATGDHRADLVWNRITALVLDFTSSPAAVAAAHTCRRRQAASRYAGLRCFQAVLQASTVNSATREAVAQIPAALAESAVDVSRGVAPDVTAALSTGSVAARKPLL